MRVVLIILLLSLMSCSQNLQISGGSDLRIVNKGGVNKGNVEGIFFNMRKIYSDETGDRVIAVAQIDADDNFQEIKPYQTYLHYKGPMGRWNIRAGHYILPFGLLHTYDTERLVLNTIESESIGIKLDTGINFFGFTDIFDYSISVSQGVGRNRLKDIDDDKIVTFRIGDENDEGDLIFGLSGLLGNVFVEKDSIIRDELGRREVYEKRLGFDLTHFDGPLTLRGEISFGKDENKTVGGGIVLLDYALSSDFELNFKYAHWQRDGGRNFIGAGFTLQIYKGLFLRVADELQFGKDDENEVTLQLYYEFFKNY